MTPFQKQFEEISEAYLVALNEGDLPGILRLFSPQGQVESPLYGQLDASVFYQQLFEDTRNSIVQLKDTLCNPSRRSGALYFSYEWAMANGKEVSFDVVDYLLLNEQFQIESLRIIYDTHHTRKDWEDL